MEHESAQPASEQSPSTSHLLGTVIGRELRTVVRTRTFYLLTAALAAVVVGITWIGGGYAAGYLPTAVDLLTPLELLVPIVAVAFGYRAILADEQRGELDVLETYPISPRELVLGVYAGRAAGLVAAIAVPMVLAAVAIAVTDTDVLAIYATHTGADSPLLFARFFVLTVLFGLVVLAIALAISSLVSGTRSALGMSIVALVALLFGFDLAIVYGLTEGLIGDDSLLYSLAMSPLSAYRGLVLETTVAVASGTGPQVASPVVSLFGFAAWTVGSLAVAIWSVGR
ncbi:ABC transporter permease subunit [Natronococcus sp. A-GB1]|jgi:Cu-processing system permease protein|uniref:ABC transporter permease n=1 Tax=Natronococcus sp. A-GB1 TaxID=3037648 RepID=UPI00241E697E|nr:ABC transporter permease subunit [Natronococcus sp. A-GB1]MDG5760172.1 ABC transporter permease subunit [Natronococcus sp. A-GB1]